MSALCQKPTSAHLFDHLVGEREELCWNFKPKGVCSLEIEGEHEFGWLLHRKIGGLRAFENPTRIGTGKSIIVRETAAITHQAASQNELVNLVNRRNRMVSRQGH